MYTLREAWLLTNGSEPVENWQGKIYCLRTDAAFSLTLNKTRGFVAAYTFTVVAAGWLKMNYNGQEITLRPDDFLVYSPGLLVEVIDASDDYRGICLMVDEYTTMDSPYVRDLLHIAYSPILQQHEPKVTLPHDDALHLYRKMEEIICYLHSNHIYKFEVLHLLCGVFLLDLQDIQSRAIVHRHVPQRVEEIFINFIHLLPRHFVEHHDIEFYASRLNISAAYLSRVVRQVSGRTVIDFINQQLAAEAAFLLHTSNLSIVQIADRLHFATLPSFSRFFKRMKGISPREFREGK